MSELIYKQDAIDAIANKIVRGESLGYEIAEDILYSVPSAGPEIIRCRDCKHHDGIRCFRWNSTIITGFDDFCSNAERRTDE